MAARLSSLCLLIVILNPFFSMAVDFKNLAAHEYLESVLPDADWSFGDHVADEDAVLPAADREKLLQIFQPMKLQDNMLSKILHGATMPPVGKLADLNVYDVREFVKQMAADEEGRQLLINFLQNYKPHGNTVNDVMSGSRVVDEKPVDRDQVQGYEGCKMDYDTLIGSLMDTVIYAGIQAVTDGLDICDIPVIGSLCEQICEAIPAMCTCTGGLNNECTLNEPAPRNSTTWGRQSKNWLSLK